MSFRADLIRQPGLASDSDRIEAARRAAERVRQVMIKKTAGRVVRQIVLEVANPSRLKRRRVGRPTWDHALDSVGGILSFNPERAPRW